jgi:hypothetical protein
MRIPLNELNAGQFIGAGYVARGSEACSFLTRLR